MRKQIDGRSSARIARSEARLQSTARDLRIFPGFSRSGKCDSRERSESERQRSVIPICESKSMEGPQPGLPEAKRGCNLRRETCGFSPALAGAENATAGAVSHHGLKSCGSHMGLSTKSEISGQVSNRSESERRRSVIPICSVNRDKSTTGLQPGRHCRYI